MCVCVCLLLGFLPPHSTAAAAAHDGDKRRRRVGTELIERAEVEPIRGGRPPPLMPPSLCLLPEVSRLEAEAEMTDLRGGAEDSPSPQETAAPNEEVPPCCCCSCCCCCCCGFCSCSCSCSSSVWMTASTERARFMTAHTPFSLTHTRTHTHAATCICCVVSSPCAHCPRARIVDPKGQQASNQRLSVHTTLHYFWCVIVPPPPSTLATSHGPVSLPIVDTSTILLPALVLKFQEPHTAPHSHPPWDTAHNTIVHTHRHMLGTPLLHLWCVFLGGSMISSTRTKKYIKMRTFFRWVWGGLKNPTQGSWTQASESISHPQFTYVLTCTRRAPQAGGACSMSRILDTAQHTHRGFGPPPESVRIDVPL